MPRIFQKPHILPTISSNASQFDSYNIDIGELLHQHMQETPYDNGWNFGMVCPDVGNSLFWWNDLPSATTL